LLNYNIALDESPPNTSFRDRVDALNSLISPSDRPPAPSRTSSSSSEKTIEGRAISVFVETLDGATMSFVLDSGDDILQLKRKIREQTGADTSTQSLYVSNANDAGMYDAGVPDTVCLKELLSTEPEIGTPLGFYVMLTEAQVCIRIYRRVHFLAAQKDATVASIWQQLLDLGAVSEPVAKEDGELMFMGQLLKRSQTLGDCGVMPRPISPEEHPLYSKRTMALLGAAEIRKSTLHVLIPDRRYM
jgi:hypothetical protein